MSGRFYVTDLTDALVRLGDDESRHARQVMRVRVGDEVELFDGAGGVGRGRIAEAGKAVVVRVESRGAVERLPPTIDLAVAIPKGDRAAVLVEKASELGADRLIPLITERSVVDPREGKLDRLRRIALESAKQCGRAWLMEVAEAMTFADVVGREGYDLKLIADAPSEPRGVSGRSEQSEQDVRSRFAALTSHGRILVLIGPEGGWTDAERAAAHEAGFEVWRLGPYVMRIETAALAALAILRQGA